MQRTIQVLTATALAGVMAAITPVTASASDFACGANAGQLGVGAAAGLVGGGAAGLGLKKMGAPKGVALLGGLALGALITDKIACLLNDQEREQVAQATQEVVNQGVGAKSDWQSATRPTVSGRSLVVAESQEGDGSICRSVTDVVIVDGEETSVMKKLCRAPGGTGFKLVR